MEPKQNGLRGRRRPFPFSLSIFSIPSCTKLASIHLRFRFRHLRDLGLDSFWVGRAVEIQAAESSDVTVSSSADWRSSRSAMVRTTDRRNLLTAACLSSDSSDCSTRSSVERSRSISLGSFTTTWMQGCVRVVPHTRVPVSALF